MKSNRHVKDIAIVRAAKSAKTVRDLAHLAGYGKYSNRLSNDAFDIGSNTIQRIKRVVGVRVYKEIASHSRFGKPRSQWRNPKH